MARVTVEDCRNYPNRFDQLFLSAPKVKRNIIWISNNVERDNDKNPVVALREVAAQKFTPDQLKESLYTVYRNKLMLTSLKKMIWPF